MFSSVATLTYSHMILQSPNCQITDRDFMSQKDIITNQQCLLQLVTVLQQKQSLTGKGKRFLPRTLEKHEICALVNTWALVQHSTVFTTQDNFNFEI